MRSLLWFENNKAGACGAGFVGVERDDGSVANGDAGNVSALERAADRLGLIALKIALPIILIVWLVKWILGRKKGPSAPPADLTPDAGEAGLP